MIYWLLCEVITNDYFKRFPSFLNNIPDIMSIEKLDLQSPDLVNANFDKLAALFPNCVTESADGKAIDFDLLKQELNHAVVEGNKERYRLEWPGKREAIVTANLPTNKTLRPIREDSVNFDTTENLYIEGDNLEVLKLLQESYLNKIKMIYIDPPYNTGNDFVYKDKFRSENELFDSGQVDELKQRLVVNPESAGRYHSDWLSMMYPRLKLARNLLKDDGVIFISIDDNEIDNLKKVCNEIFGEMNFVSQVIWKSKYGAGAKTKGYIDVHEYILCFSKNPIENLDAPLGEESMKSYSNKDDKFEVRGGYFTQPLMTTSMDDRPNLQYSIFYNGVEIKPRKQWVWSKERLLGEIEKDNIIFSKKSDGTYSVRAKQYIKDEKGVIRKGKPLSVLIGPYTQEGTNDITKLFDQNVFGFTKPISLLSYLFSFETNEKSNQDCIILDFFSGSGSTAQSIMQLNAIDILNRKYIQVQIPEATDEKSEAHKAGYKNICDIGKERIRRAGKSILDGVTKELGEKRAQLAKYTEGSLGLSGDEKVETLTGEITKLEGVVATLDTGFRVYRLDESNMKDVYYKPQDITQASLALTADNVKPDRTADDLLAQVMLDWGLPLSLKIEQAVVAEKKVFKVAGNSLYACFDSGIDEGFAKAIAIEQPLRIVFHDSGFANDTAKINVKQLLKQLSPDTVMKVI
jgi:adenine-specific DNA-methyltransferase